MMSTPWLPTGPTALADQGSASLPVPLSLLDLVMLLLCFAILMVGLRHAPQSPADTQGLLERHGPAASAAAQGPAVHVSYALLQPLVAQGLFGPARISLREDDLLRLHLEPEALRREPLRRRLLELVRQGATLRLGLAYAPTNLQRLTEPYGANGKVMTAALAALPPALEPAVAPQRLLVADYEADRLPVILDVRFPTDRQP